MRLENEIQNEVRQALGAQSGCVWWRNNVGQAQFVSPQGRVSHVRYGLSEGSSDLIGIVSLVITPDMVGQRVGRFSALELKSERGKTDPARRELQWLFRDLVNGLGGYAEQLSDPQQALAALARARTL